MLRVLASAATLAWVAGCTTVGPDYVAPVVTVPVKFAGLVPARPARSDDAQAFWSGFGDPALSALVAQAAAANHDIRVAQARLREARGLRSEASGDRLPSIVATAAASRNRFSRSDVPGATRSQRTDNAFEDGFDAGWELDLFGGIRRRVEAATARAEGSEAELAAVRVSVMAETARVWFEWHGLEQRLRIAADNLQNQRDTLAVTEKRYRVGRVTAFDVDRGRTLVETTRATIPALQAASSRAANALAVLTAQVPAAITIPSREPAALEQSLPLFVLGNPASLLRRRPDVVAAELGVAAAVASIGVSTAELFPSVRLVGGIGLAADSGSGLAQGGAVRYGFGPTLAWNILDFGRIRSRIEQADARHDAALASYEQAVLRALQEAEDALTSVDRLAEQAGSVNTADLAARDAARLALIRFKAGATDFIDLLDAQRRVLETSDALARVQTARRIAAVALFKAMGGGWSPSVTETSSREQARNP